MQTLRNWARRHPIVIGVALIYLFTWAIDLTLALQSQGQIPVWMPAWAGFFTGYALFAATLLAALLVEGWPGIVALLRRFLIWRVGLRWYAAALLLPLGIALLALALAAAFLGATPDFARPFARTLVSEEMVDNLLGLALIWIVFEILNNGEEIGWRGFLLPRLLARHNALVATLILGVIWALWHLPKFWLGGPSDEAHSYPFWVFTLDIVAQAVLLTWIYLHTRGSLLLATLFHAAHNTSMMLLPVIPAVPEGAPAFYIAIGLRWLVVAVLVATLGTDLVGQRSGEDLPQSTQSAQS